MKILNLLINNIRVHFSFIKVYPTKGGQHQKLNLIFKVIHTVDNCRSSFFDSAVLIAEKGF